MTTLGRADQAFARPTIGDIRRSRDTLIAAGDASALIVANALASILRGGDAVIALGLKPAAGNRSALTLERMTSRDELLRRMAARHFSGQSISEQARQIDGLAKLYWVRAAARDVSLEDVPDSYVGMPREFLFHIARLPASVPSERTLRQILQQRHAPKLAASPPYSLPTKRRKSQISNFSG